MTRKDFVNMIALAESGDKPKTVGDGGLAAGRFQMHFVWRLDYWPDWAWETLALLDRYALEYFITHDNLGQPRRPWTARSLADLFNLGHQAIDGQYDQRCLRALETLGVGAEQFDTIVE